MRAPWNLASDKWERGDRETWARMRAALWPDAPGEEHAKDIDAIEQGHHLRNRTASLILLIVSSLLAIAWSFASPRQALWAFALNVVAPWLARRDEVKRRPVGSNCVGDFPPAPYSQTIPAPLSGFPDIADQDPLLVKACGDFQRTAQRFDVTAQIAHVHVRPFFQLGHGRLSDRKIFADFLLRQRPRLPQFLQRHCLAQCGGLRRHTGAARRREILRQVAKRPVSGHGIKPSFLISGRPLRRCARRSKA
jgi:hypothetical protein